MRITALITCYNRQHRIGNAVRSVLEQTVPPAEVLVVDDGSSDGSAAVLAEFGSRIRVIRTENQGASQARNRGISEATGEWIALLDSDDQWYPDKLQKQIAVTNVFPDVDFVFCDTEVMRGSEMMIASRFALGGVRGAEVCRDANRLRFDRSLFLRMVEQSRIFTSGVLVRRQLKELRFPEDLVCCNDWPVWMNLVLRYPFAAVDEVLVRMHHDGDNLTSRIGRILRNNLIVLNRLRADSILTAEEREAAERAYKSQRIGAMYHSLIEGDNVEARTLLNEIPADDIADTRRIAYWCASWFPKPFLRQLAKWRLKANVA
jgi:glycosyltransferase involved in cell wall biosynthesis